MREKILKRKKAQRRGTFAAIKAEYPSPDFTTKLANTCDFDAPSMSEGYVVLI